MYARWESNLIIWRPKVHASPPRRQTIFYFLFFPSSSTACAFARAAILFFLHASHYLDSPFRGASICSHGTGNQVAVAPEAARLARANQTGPGVPHASVPGAGRMSLNPP